LIHTAVFITKFLINPPVPTLYVLLLQASQWAKAQGMETYWTATSTAAATNSGVYYYASSAN
jgi:hypothetical protein